MAEDAFEKAVKAMADIRLNRGEPVTESRAQIEAVCAEQLRTALAVLREHTTFWDIVHRDRDGER